MRGAGLLALNPSGVLPLLGIVLTFGWLACGSADITPDPAGADVKVDLRITLRDGDRGPLRKWTLRCGQVGNSWPDARGACRRLLDPEARAAFAPITTETRDLVDITETPLVVTGRLAGRKIDLRIPVQGSSTRLKRYRSVRRALGSRAFDQAARTVREG